TLAISFGYRQQDLLETGPPVAIDRREVRPTVKRFAFWSEEHGERPSTGAGNRRHGELVAAVNIGALVAIDLHGDEFAVDDRGDVAALIGLAVHDVAPVAPHRANVEQNRLVLALGGGKGLFAPLVPLDWLVHRGAQISRRSADKRIVRFTHRASV